MKPQDDKAYAKRTVNGGDSPVSAKSRDYSKGEKGAATVDNITWSYSIQGGEATIVSPTGKLYERAVTPQPVGDIAIPPSVNGTPVTGIGKFALCNCPELASVRIPNSVKHIDEWAFSGCRKLTSVTVPSSVDNIGKCVFASCPRLVEINVVAGNSKYVAVDGVVYTRDMKRLVTGVGGLMSVNVPPGVEEIDREAFRCCRELKSVTMPLSVKTIGREAFLASGLESVIVPSSVSRIEPWAFWCCTGLRSVTIHEGVAIIGNQAFYQCRNLKEVLVPTSVKYIEADAFKDCRELVSVTMSGERPDTRGSIFEKCDKLAAIHVSANAKSWAGMKEWQGIPLVFDAESKK